MSKDIIDLAIENNFETITNLLNENSKVMYQNEKFKKQLNEKNEKIKKLKFRWNKLKTTIQTFIETSKAIKELNEFGKGELGQLESILCEMEDLERRNNNGNND